MRSIFLLIALFCCSFSIYAKGEKGESIFPHKDGEVVYEKVEDQTGDVPELYRSARKFFTSSNKDVSFEITQEDEKEGYVDGKGVMKYKNYTVNFDVNIQVKDGRYKYTIDNIEAVMPTTAMTVALAPGLKSTYKNDKTVVIPKWSWVYKNEKRSNELNEKFLTIAENIKGVMSNNTTADEW